MNLFNIFSNNEKARNKSHIKNLIEVAIADGKIDESEFELIVEIASKYDISKAEAIAIRDNQSEIEFYPRSNYKAKVTWVEDLVNVLLADKVIEENELRVCKELAKKLKLSEYLVDDLINTVLNNR